MKRKSEFGLALRTKIKKIMRPFAPWPSRPLSLTSLMAQPAHADWHSLTGLLPESVDNRSPQFSPDSAYVVYTVDVDVDGQNDLYSAVVSDTQATPP